MIKRKKRNKCGQKYFRDLAFQTKSTEEGDQFILRPRGDHVTTIYDSNMATADLKSDRIDALDQKRVSRVLRRRPTLKRKSFQAQETSPHTHTLVSSIPDPYPYFYVVSKKKRKHNKNESVK